MVDVFDRYTRSRNMAAIRGRDTKPELIVRRYVHGRGLRFRLHAGGLPGKPDLVFTRLKAVVFVHGCFWHQHAGCKYATSPKTNTNFWKAKFDANRRRDRRSTTRLRKAGWRVFVAWECSLDERSLDRIYRKLILQPRSAPTRTGVRSPSKKP
jgi:DNA mismatch endonuclease (patch repair protein)